MNWAAAQMQFTRDDRYQEIAEAFALDAIDFARANMKLDLDWSDQSIQVLEAVADYLFQSKAQSNPSEELIYRFAKMLGSYLGEVYRKNHGATWGTIEHDGETFPGLETSNGNLFWPWGRLDKRLTEGDENNVWHYYLHLTGKL